MKKIRFLVIIFMILLCVYGCGKKSNNNDVANKKNSDEVQEITDNTSKNDDEKVQDETDQNENKSQEVSTDQNNSQIENNQSQNNNQNQDSNQEQNNNQGQNNNQSGQNEDNGNQQQENTNNKKIVVCSMTETSNKYDGFIRSTTTFENGSIVYHTLYVEKKFKNNYKAEDDDWTISNKEAIENSNTKGISGVVEIRNNITYLTANYNVKENEKLLEMITSHTEYNDFLNNMRNNGYMCTEG